MHPRDWPEPRVPATEFALRLADAMRAQLPEGNTTALDVVRSMGEPELVDVFCALAVGAATAAWAAAPRKPWYPIVDPAPELALASTVLHYAYWGDVEALAQAVRQSRASDRVMSATWLALHAPGL